MQIRTFAILAIVSLLVATVCISDTSTSATSNPPQMNSLIPRNVQVWKSAELEHPDLVDISLDGKYVVAGDSEFNEVSLLDETGKTLWKFALPPQLAAPRIRWLHISDDGKYVAFGGNYIDGAEGEFIRGFVFFFDRQGHVWNKTDLADIIMTGSISGEGDRLAIGYGSRVEVLDKAGVLKWGYDFDPHSVNSVSISSNGDYVAVGHGGGVSLLYGGSPLWEQQWEDERGHPDTIYPVRISADGKYVIAIAQHTQSVLYYNQAGTLLWNRIIELYSPGASPSRVQDHVAISSNGESAVAVGNTTIYFFDKTGLQWSYDTEERELTSVDMSSDGNFIVASSRHGQKVLHFNKDGTLIWEITPPDDIGPVAISGNGEYFATTDTFAGNIHLYFSKKYFNYRFVTPDGEPISDLDVKWYFPDGTFRTSILTDAAGWIEFFDPYSLDYSTNAYYWQTKVGSYVLVKETGPPLFQSRYETANTHVASLFDWDIYIEGSGGFPLPATVEIYLWNNTLHDRRTTDHLRFENMPKQTYIVRVYYADLPVIVREVALIEDEQVLTITIPDVTPPIAEAGENQTVNEDTIVTLDGSGSTDDIRIASYDWSFDDITPQTLTGITATYIFETPGIYMVTLDVTDVGGNPATDTVTITVNDITPPVAEAGNAQTMKVNTEVSFNAGGSSDNVEIVNYEWDFGDGNTGTGVTTIHIYTKPVTYTVTLTVTDAHGNSTTDTIPITVEEEPAFPIWMIAVIIAAVAVIVIAVYFIVKRKAS